MIIYAGMGRFEPMNMDEMHKALVAIAELKAERDRLRAALVGACEALEYNDEDSAYSILKTARRALEGDAGGEGSGG